MKSAFRKTREMIKTLHVDASLDNTEYCPQPSTLNPKLYLALPSTHHSNLPLPFSCVFPPTKAFRTLLFVAFVQNHALDSRSRYITTCSRISTTVTSGLTSRNLVGMLQQHWDVIVAL